MGSKQGGKNSANFKLNISPDTKKGIVAILFFAVALVTLLSFLNLAGTVGQYLDRFFSLALGWGKWEAPVIIFVLGYLLLRKEELAARIGNYSGVALFIFTFQALLQLGYPLEQMRIVDNAGQGGGYLGLLIAYPAVKYLGVWASAVILVALLVVALLLIFQTSLSKLFFPILAIGSKLVDFINWLRGEYTAKQEDKLDKKLAHPEDYRKAIPEAEVTVKITENVTKTENKKEERITPEQQRAAEQNKLIEVAPLRSAKIYNKIEVPVDLLGTNQTKAASGDTAFNQTIIHKTLENFGISCELGEVNIGPTFTQYTLRPADGIKLSRVTALNSDLSMALAAHPIRIEAPIPGRSLVGIEVPNQAKAQVGLREMLESQEFKTRKSNLSLALGKDVTGKSYFVDLTRLPHLLIAGSTGSGKTVCINSIITSLLYQNSPEELKFILIDPKRVEMPVYNGIPHLITPVVTDVKKTINALKWCVLEMDRRFELLSRVGKRNIESYNNYSEEKMPYIVVVVDELADLMVAAASEIETLIIRLAQMARAVGIHLVVATQRPSVDVITGLIKANISGRIAFAVNSLTDSRTILDSAGAEKLVGRGDMLFISAEVSKPKRLQGVYVSDQEIIDIAEYLKEQGEPEYIDDVVTSSGPTTIFGGTGPVGDDSDELLPQAVEIIQQSGKASASLFQRRLKVGYARAARLLDLLENQGLIGPGDGAKPREVYWDKLGGQPNNLSEEEPAQEIEPSEVSVQMTPEEEEENPVN